MESKIMKSIDGLFGEITCIKGYTAEGVGGIFKAKWDRFDKPVAIGLDASRFDQHCSQSALKYEHGFYRGLFPGQRELNQLLDWQLVNRGVGYVPDGAIKYVKSGCRMSGDINTSLGNYILMCAMCYGFMKSLNIEKYSLANCGDDCVIIVERRHLSNIQSSLDSYFLNKGFTMKMEEPVYKLEEVEFCQAHPVETQVGWKMVRNLRVAMSKDIHCVNNIKDVETRKAWSTAQHLGGRALASGVPVVDVFYSRFMKYDVKKRHQRVESVGSLYKWRGSGLIAEVTPQARASFWQAFKLNGDEQSALEDRLGRWTMDLLGPVGVDYHEPSILDHSAS